MTSAQTCPSCGETDHLHGISTSNGIEIVCERCGERWVRGSLPCRSCGGIETLTLPQVIVRTSRGNQLSIMGHRDITLCPACDAEVIASCKTTRQWVPEHYVSAFSFDLAESPDIRSTAVSVPTDPPEASLKVETRPTAPTPNRPDQARFSKASPATEPAAARPTVRQAIQEYMSADPDTDPVAMLSLGTHLGSSTRLEALGTPGQAFPIQEWFRDTWGDHDATRRATVHQSIRGAFDFWVANGWLSQDPTINLQP